MPALKQNSLLAAANGHLAVALRDHVRKNAENRPGVYRMLSADGQIVYVGKSVRLRSRLLSYFRADRGEKATEIISAARHIEWEYTHSEFAALLLELASIQRWRPLFNVQHKVDRGHCFIKLTKDEAPRLLMTLHVVEDGALYYGPFRGRKMVRSVLREIRDLLELRDCPPTVKLRFADQIDLFNFDATPACIRADLHKCLAPCAGRCTRAEYLHRIEEARQFLHGGVHSPLKLLKLRMQEAAERMQFEYAAQLRDRGMRLRDARAELVNLRDTFERLTFLYTVPGYRGNDWVYLIRKGRIERDWPAPANPAEEQKLLAEAQRIFNRRTGNGSVDARQVAEIMLIARWFRLHPDEFHRTTPPASQDTSSRISRPESIPDSRGMAQPSQILV